MSTPGTPAGSETSISLIRGLLERNLTDRAVALSESRWPGSGPLVQLANEWGRLTPATRRERLAAIGPEDLSRMRAVADLQPDLARVLDDLEARGIIPPPQQLVFETPPEAMTREEAVVDAMLDLAEEKTVEAIDDMQAQIAPTRDEIRRRRVTRASEKHTELDRLPQTDMPTLDLGLPTTSQFLAEEVDRRARAVEQAEDILARVRGRMTDAGDRLLASPRLDAVPEVAPVPIQQLPVEDQALEPRVAVALDDEQYEQAPASVRSDLPERFRTRVVIVSAELDRLPSMGEVSSTANSLGLGLVELDTSSGTRAFYGGLERDGRRITPRAGAFPSAASRPNLVVVHGRLYPKAIERLEQGYCDIPGTQATVKLHPRCKVLTLPARG